MLVFGFLTNYLLGGVLSLYFGAAKSKLSVVGNGMCVEMQNKYVRVCLLWSLQLKQKQWTHPLILLLCVVNFYDTEKNLTNFLN